MSKKKIRNQACHCGSGKKFKDCHLYLHWKEHIPILKMKWDFPMPILIKDEFVITGTFENKRVKLFKVFFTSDWTLNVDFPYFTDPNAILDELIIPPWINYPADITLKHTWKLTSHRVKFAHHISWEVHFSQDWKIRTEVRKKSLPLKEVRGHIFTVMLQGIDSFKEARKEKDFAHTNGRWVL